MRPEAGSLILETGYWVLETGYWKLVTSLTRCLALAFALALIAPASADDNPPPATRPSPLPGVEEIVFAVRPAAKDPNWFADIGHYATNPKHKAYTGGARLCRLNLDTGKVVTLREDLFGGIRDPQVHYDARKVLFSYRKADSEYYHLYEINIDGTGLHQLTDGPFDDIEPTYLPDGGIMFCSTRCKRYVQCWMTPVANLHRCDANGAHIREVSTNCAPDNTPWPLPDGRILYTRWEYVNRSQLDYHHLWIKNPDGTGEMTFYGNMNPGTLMIDAKPIPDTNKVVAIFSPGHGLHDHDGCVTIVDPSLGPDDPSSARTLNPTPDFRDPYALSQDCILVARGPELLVMDSHGATQSVYALPEKDRNAGLQCHEPRPVLPHDREHVFPTIIDPSAKKGFIVAANVSQGRNMAGVKPDQIKRLLFLEVLPKPVNFTGGMEPLTYGGAFTLERIVGTAPVEPDGSAFVAVPAMRSLVIAALDEQGRTVKRMQSFLSVMPGEQVSCVGCHEQRTRTPANPGAGVLLALRAGVNEIDPIRDIPDVLDFPRDIQPILDKHCTACHGYDATPKGGPRAGGVILTGDRGPVYSHSYFTLSAREQIADGRNRPQSNYPPYAFGSGGSPLMKKIESPHCQSQLSDRERKLIRLWLDTGATYPGTYAALGTGMIGGYVENQLDRSDTTRPSGKAFKEIIDRRCASCHSGTLRLPDSPSDDMDMPPWAIQYGDSRLRFSRHIVYNLTRPEKSLLLLAPLSAQAGGYGICQANATRLSGGGANAVFPDRADPDYRKLLAAVQDTKTRLNMIRRFDMPSFTPSDAYLREMKEFSIYTDDTAGEPVDVYRTDQEYWRSLWWRPEPPAWGRIRWGMGP